MPGDKRLAAIDEEPQADAASRLRWLRIDTYREFVVYMHRDSEVSRSEGFEVRSRVGVRLNGKTIVATLNVVSNALLSIDEASLSESAWKALQAEEGQSVVFHPPPLSSDGLLRKKVYGGSLEAGEFALVIDEVTQGLYDDIHIAAFLTACAGDRLNAAETIDLTTAMINAGTRLQWNAPKVADKHCIGGLPGNCTSMIIVPIIAAAGLLIPKTSSRAITSPAGTADAMETFTRVDLDLSEMRRVVEREGGCIVWGVPSNSARLTISSFVSNVLWISTAKANWLPRFCRRKSRQDPRMLSSTFLSARRQSSAPRRLPGGSRSVSRRQRVPLALKSASCRLMVPSRLDGELDRHSKHAMFSRYFRICRSSADLRSRSLTLCAELLELMGAAAEGHGLATATGLLDSGAAWKKFQSICEAQGGMKAPTTAPHHVDVTAARAGFVMAVDNRRLAKVAKLAGAPHDPLAGVDFHARVGMSVARGQPLYTIFAQTPG